MSEPIDLDELERLAKAATPGPWTALGPCVFDDRAQVAEAASGAAADGQYLAACSPDRILALVEEVRRVRSARDDLLSEVRDLERELREAYSDPRLQFP